MATGSTRASAAHDKSARHRGDSSDTEIDLGRWDPGWRKRDPLKVLKAANRGRVTALLPLKAERMRASAFGFFRGSAALMAYDLSLGPHTAILNQLCGDAHLQNLGAYAGIDGRLIFDVNDFDETTRGPFEWDVKRMATSVLLAGEQAGLDHMARSAAAAAFLESYHDLIQCLAPMPVLEAARYQVRRLHATAPLAGLLQQAERASPLHLRDKLTEVHKGKRVFRAVPGLQWRVRGAERRQVLLSLHGYRKSLLPERQHFFDQFRPLDVAFKVVGTGSVGLRDYLVYCEGNGPDDPLFLQIKEETDSAYARYLPRALRGKADNGRRVAEGQRAMQLQSDPLLGWTAWDKRTYLVRQLNDHKASLDVTGLPAEALAAYARVCGEMLARGHARSGSAHSIAVVLHGGKHFQEEMLRFAESYAAQCVADWQALVAAGPHRGSAKPTQGSKKKAHKSKKEAQDSAEKTNRGEEKTSDSERKAQGTEKNARTAETVPTDGKPRHRKKHHPAAKSSKR